MSTTTDAAEPSSLSPQEPHDQEQEHSFGSFAYERVLSKSECRKVQRVERHLAASLDGTVHVWVRDARPFAHGRESSVDAFQLRLHASLPVAEVRDRIQERYEEISSYREASDGPLQLFFDGRTLEDGKLLAEYVSHCGGDKASREWPAPFAGILWIVPFRPATRLAPHLWSA